METYQRERIERVAAHLLEQGEFRGIHPALRDYVAAVARGDDQPPEIPSQLVDQFREESYPVEARAHGRLFTLSAAMRLYQLRDTDAKAQELNRAILVYLDDLFSEGRERELWGGTAHPDESALDDVVNRGPKADLYFDTTMSPKSSMSWWSNRG